MKKKEYSPTGHELRVMPLSCPDCSGVLSFDQEGPRGHRLYVCQIGHRYSTTSLLHSKESELERTLWSASVLLKQMADAYEQLLKEMPRTDSERKLVQCRIHEVRKQSLAIRAIIEATMQCHRINDYPVSRKRRSNAINGARIKRDIIVIGASAGGVPALQQIFADFPSGMRATVGVVLHRGVNPSELVQVLGRRSTLSMKEPTDTVPIQQGTIYLAPPDHHLLFERGKVSVQRGPREHSTRPSVDPLFRSAAETYGPRVVGLLLTGCGEDGVSGLIAITERNGLTLVQDPDEAYMPSMPLNAIRFDEVVGVVSLNNAARMLASLANGEQVRIKITAGR